VHIEGFNANQAELELALAIEELAWVSIERTGSRINVKISERLDGGDSNEIAVTTPCNIIAGRTGQLIKAEVYRGELLYELGSGVSAGDIVVSGVIHGGIVHADALLLAEIVEIVDFYQPFSTKQRAANGHSMSNRSIVFLGMRFGGELDICPHSDHVQYTQSMTAPNIFGFPLPFRVLNQDYVFYDRLEVIDPPVTALNKLNRQIDLYETNFLSDAEIIERQVEYFPDENGVGALVRYIFHTDIAVKSEIFTEN
jgi:similar to stage IV sporulation protein